MAIATTTQQTIEGGVSLRYLGSMLNISMQTRNRNIYSFSATAREFQVKPEDAAWFLGIRERGIALFEAVIQPTPQPAPQLEIPVAEPLELQSFSVDESEVTNAHAVTQESEEDIQSEDHPAKRKPKKHGRPTS